MERNLKKLLKLLCYISSCNNCGNNLLFVPVIKIALHKRPESH